VKRVAEADGRSVPILKLGLGSKTAVQPFTASVNEVGKSIRETRAALLQRRAGYLYRGGSEGMNDTERDASDAAVQKALKGILGDLRGLESSDSTGLEGDGRGHREGMLSVLRESAAACTSMLVEQRQYRMSQQAQTARPQRSLIDTDWEKVQADGTEEGMEDLTAEEEAMMLSENDAVLREMDCLNSQVEDVTRKMAEISELASLFSAKMVEQKEMAENVYDLTLESSENMKAGNENMEKASASGVDFRILMIAFLLISSICILFLDWYDGYR